MNNSDKMEDPQQKSIHEIKIDLIDIPGEQEETPGDVDFDLLCFKNENSYLIAKKSADAQLIEEGQQVCSACLAKQFIYKTLTDVIFYSPLNCYFIAEKDSRIYRKDIDADPAYPIINLHSLSFLQCSLRSSALNRNLIFNEKGRGLVVIDPKHQKVDFKMKECPGAGDKLEGFEIIGDRQNRIIQVESSGVIALKNIEFKKKKILSLTSTRIHPKTLSIVSAYSLTVCLSHTYACVAGCSPSLFIWVFEIGLNSLKFKTRVKGPGPDSLGLYIPIKCFEYVDENLSFVTLNPDLFDAVMTLYQLDPQNNELAVVTQENVDYSICSVLPESLERLGNFLYFPGREFKILKVRLVTSGTE